MPVWAGKDPSEYGAWAPLFIVPWAISGVAAAGVILVAERFATRARRG